MNNIDNNIPEKLTINLVYANTFALLFIIPIFILFGLPYILIWNDQFTIQYIKENLPKATNEWIYIQGFLFIAVMFLGIVLHELIHGITWAYFANKGFKSIKFGVLWKMVTPYCHCIEPLTVKHYILGAVMPAIILGIIPSIIAIAIGSLGLILFGTFFTLAAGGDFLMINILRKEKFDSLVQDHPSEIGCYIYRKGNRA